MKTIILASASPRRREILKKAGLSFRVVESEVEEDLPPGLPPHELARSLALQKAGDVAGREKDAVIIAADTIVVVGERVLGKPHTGGEARRMLAALSGREHSVVTGFAVIDTGTGKTRTGSVETRVWFRPLGADEIERYVETGEPLDKAGAYAIQGRGAALVERTEGDYLNVVGLPLEALLEALEEFGIKRGK